MGIFAWFRRGGRGVKPSSDASTGDAAPEDATGKEDGAVAIPKQTAAAEAADSEAGDSARQ
jgi:hypothetical protein